MNKNKSLDDQFSQAIMRGMGGMSFPRWVIASAELGMSKSEIQSDMLAMQVIAVWNAKESKTPESLRETMELSDIELTEALGVNYDALVAERIEKADKQAA